MMPESKRPVSIEDLLRLKRAERPPPEFWGEFDRQLRAKQLAALVAKRPWWQSLPRVWSGVTRYHLAFGASAVLAVTFVALRDQAPDPAAPKGEPAPVARIAVQAAEPVASEPAHAVRRDSSPAISAPVVVAPEASAQVAAASPAFVVPEPALASEATAPGELSRMVAFMGARVADQNEEVSSPSARHIAANLAAVQASDPVFGQGLLATLVDRADTKPAIEPLQQITPPSGKRRAHMLTAMVSMASYDTTDTTQRVANRIKEEQLYDRVRRLGGGGDRVHIKF